MQSEVCDFSGLKSRERGKTLSTELWGRPGSGRRKKQQWRYQRRYRMKSKRGESYLSNAKRTRNWKSEKKESSV